MATSVEAAMEAVRTNLHSYAEVTANLIEDIIHKAAVAQQQQIRLVEDMAEQYRLNGQIEACVTACAIADALQNAQDDAGDAKDG